jgi:hypothetical protein
VTGGPEESVSSVVENSGTAVRPVPPVVKPVWLVQFEPQQVRFMVRLFLQIP